MDNRYYQILRNASQEDFYRALNDREEELYDVLWNLFESVVIEPAEIFDGGFRDRNQFRYGIDEGVVLEFFPEISYFENRREPAPYRDGCNAAGVHLKLLIQPSMSCLFSVGFQVWGRSEQRALKNLWLRDRPLLTDILHRANPTVFTVVPFPAVDHATSLDGMLDNYFSVRDPEHFLELQYPFAQFDDNAPAQDFMVYMAALYHTVKDFCQTQENTLPHWMDHVRDFYSGSSPELPPPLPCVEVNTGTDM